MGELLRAIHIDLTHNYPFNCVDEVVVTLDDQWPFKYNVRGF